MARRRGQTHLWKLLIPLLLVASGLALPGAVGAAEPAPSISGIVTVAATGLPIEGVIVCAIKRGGGGIRCVSTDAEGKYTVENLEAGEWIVEFSTEGLESGLLEQSWDDRYEPEAPDPVVLGSDTHAEGIDAALRSGGEIEGTVSSLATGAPLGEIRVCLVKASTAAPVHCVKTDSAGAYSFESVASGTYKVAFSPEMEEIYGELVREIDEETGEDLFPPDGYATQWWDRQTSFSAATAITVNGAAVLSGIDGLLVPPSAQITPPGGGGGTSGGGSATPAPPATPAPSKPTKKPLTCRRGLVKRKVNGKARCVKRHKPARHRHKRRRRHAA